jgi:hypothetical protein
MAACCDNVRSAVEKWSTVVRSAPVTSRRIRRVTDGQNAIYQLADMLDRLMSQEPRTSLDAAMVASNDAPSANDYRLSVVSLFGEALDLCAHTRVSDARAAEVVGDVRQMMASFIIASGRATVAEFSAIMGGPQTLRLLRAIGDIASSHIDDSVQPLSRADLVSSTDELVEFLRSSDMPPLARDAMILKLNAVGRIARECDFMPDDEIRRRVKAVYADFCSEFERMEKRNSSWLERVGSWARRNTKRGFFALSLTSDASQVAGLLMPPK